MASFLPSLGQSESDSAPERPESERYDDEGNYRATVLDIEAVHGVFAALKPLLPPEMVDKILDIAEYWACSTQTVDFTGRRDGSNRVLGNSSIQDKLMIRTAPVGLSQSPYKANPSLWNETFRPPRPLRTPYSPRELDEMFSVDGVPRTLANPCRKIVFTIESRDQGWGGEPEHRETYRGSWTWFEAGIERLEKDSSCPEDCPDRYYLSAPSGPTSRHVDIQLPICSLRPVDPPLQSLPQNAPASTTAGEHGHTPQWAYDHGLLPNEARKIVCNRTATPQVEKKRVVWRWDDNVRDEDQPRSASAGGQGDIQNGTPNEGRVAGAGGAQEEQRPLGSTANEAVERLERDGRGRRTGDGEFVRSLQLGDVVTVWAKARFPAWANNVNKITVDVYFAV